MRLISGLAICIALLQVAPAFATLNAFLPVADANVRRFDSPYELIHDGDSIVVHRIDFAGLDNRGILEYDLSRIPVGSRINSASIEFDIRLCNCSPTGGPTAPIYGYAGNGSAELEDAFREENLIGTVTVRSEPDIITAEIDPQFVEDVRGQTQYLGIALVGSSDNNSYGFASGELSARIPVFPATLLVDFDSNATLLGDSNGDGIVNTLDINPFVLALTDEQQFLIDFPSVDYLDANDTNQDGVVNTLDINPFVALLTGGGSAIPEPSALLLAVFAWPLIVGRRLK